MTQTTSYLAIALIVSLFQLGSAGAEEKAPAFPGAEGFGACARGGRGGKALTVTTLDDYVPGKDDPIPGSLREACQTKGPRIVAFGVSGTIQLKAPLVIDEPYMTLDGQTAPGGGVCVKNYGTSVNTKHVIIRHMRFRPGDEVGRELAKHGKAWETDALSIGGGAENVIFDHCSASWANDEVLSVSGAGITNVTVQWCIISESLNASTHVKGKHGYGTLLRTNGNVTFHHNIYAHHRSRCPRPGTYGDGCILLDFRNNLIYNGTGYSAADPVRMNYVGNVIKRPRGHVFSVGGPATRLYVEGNHLIGAGARNDDNWNLISTAKPANKMSKPFPVAPVTTHTALQAYEKLLAGCGATLPKRDAVDARIVNDIRTGKGDLINSSDQVGGWPTLE
jgi:pectate lyase